MNAPGRSSRYAGLALALVLGVLAATAAPGAGARLAGSTTFTDPAGDAAGAPDVTALSVSDSAAGTIQFAVTVAGMQPITTVDVYLDTDRNPATGDSYGSEYALEAGYDNESRWWDVFRWDGTQFTEIPQSATLGFSRSGDTYTFVAGKADLGGTTGFSIVVVAATWDASEEVTAADRAPDGGAWVYDLSTATTKSTPPTAPAADKPWIGKPASVPAKATAGHRFAVSFPVTRENTGAPLTKGTMICDPSVAGKVIAHTESFKNGNARLAFTIPKTAKGRVLTVKLTIRLGSQSASKVVTYRVG